MDSSALVTTFALGALFGLAAGAIGAWWLTRGRIAWLQEQLVESQEEVAARQDQHADMLSTVARLEAALNYEKKMAAEQLAFLDRATSELRQSFQALSAETLHSNAQTFLSMATHTLEKVQAQAAGELARKHDAVTSLVAPLEASLSQVNTHLHDLEAARQQAYGRLSEQVHALMTSQERLQAETGNLAKALRAPTVRGRWGEMQLRRVVEMAGMVPYCDFAEQVSIATEETRLRPDMVVNLPGGKQVVVDAKTPLKAYLEALDATSEPQRRQLMQTHARHVRGHINRLSAKAYREQFDHHAPEFAVMFLPGESFFSAALEHDPSLIEAGVAQRVILATPTTLIALLRAVAYGWQQDQLAANAQAISKLGRELYDRLRVLAEHVASVGKSLDRSVESYNRMVGSLDGRVLVTARRFAELGLDPGKEIPELTPVERMSRSPQAPEWDRENPGLFGDA
ncbi:DNA recombination protein RmuC [Candidatus Entotheonella palauensis]|uniref:DNA recombination protein RmuC n=1 Tax=Candidatus Entotheonella palauensis TaxID=93172 RepID=UPI000B7F86CD|nr:DNA recombination protein RmuC [Candidatus Entotheonella palauensis]